MNAEERFTRLVATARREPAPTPDVTAPVLARLPRRAWRPDAWPSVALAACAALTLVCGWCGFQAWSALLDPLAGWLT